MSQQFPKPYEPFEGDINVKADLSIYATKANLKNAKGVNISKLAAKSYNNVVKKLCMINQFQKYIYSCQWISFKN